MRLPCPLPWGDDLALHTCKEAHTSFSGSHILPTTEGMSLFFIKDWYGSWT